MTRLTLILRGLSHHWRLNLTAGIAAAVGTGVLIGALLVGDSVRYSLRAMALERLGRTEIALVAGDRFFKADLAERLKQQPEFKKDFDGAEPLILIPGVAINDSTNARATDVQVVGVRDGFWKFEDESGLSFNTQSKPRISMTSGEVVLNSTLAQKLNVKTGDTVRLRISKPGILPHDAPLGSKEDHSALLRAKVRIVLDEHGLGRFSLNANQIAPFNAFIPIADLQDKLKQSERANVLLIAGSDAKADPEAVSHAQAAFAAAWNLDDAQLRVRAEQKLGFAELSSPRVFLDDAVTEKLTQPLTPSPSPRRSDANGVVTYFVNSIRANGKETPYSMVTAAEAPLVPVDLKDDEIILNEWTADDLQAKPDDKVEIEYFTVGLLRKLETHKANFTVKAVMPIAGLQADRGLMPDFPGIAEVESEHDWDSSIPIDMNKIRKKDDEYWKKYKGTPKAFIALKRGVELWKNRFGSYTALRFPDTDAKKISDDVKSKISPAMVGLTLLPVKRMALAAGDQAIDFGMLFLGFSFFLITAALLLMALIFRFNVEARTSETGLLLALGFRRKSIRAMLWSEGAVMAVLGSAIGVFGGIYYARWLLNALGTRWQEAVGTSALEYHAEPASIAIGCVSGIIIAALAIFLAVRKQGSLSARELLATSANESPRAETKPARWPLIVFVISLLGAIGIVAEAFASKRIAAAESFFSAGGLLLIAGIALTRMLLNDRNKSLITESNASGAVLRLGVRSAARRRGRSLATVALLASGTFLVVAVGANKQDASAGAEKKESGTGGFALIAKSTIPIYEDLNSPKGREKLGVQDEGLAGATIYPFRVKAGDEASCLNLNRAQQPKILGVPKSFIERGGFTFASVDRSASYDLNTWEILGRWNTSEFQNAPIPGICDYQSLTYALGKSVGDEIEIKDEKGAPRKIKIVGAVANSILQGAVLISEDEFVKLYPSESGYSEFLIDASPQIAGKIASFLETSLQDEGFSSQTAVQKLAQFNAVENTYLSTFEALGGLGMILGSFGLGIVVMRNVLERRGELAILRAIGFSRGALNWMVLSEHLWLLLLGLLAGVISALVAVVPALQSTTVPVPWPSIGVSLAGVIICGVFATIVATWAMLRAPLVEALRNE